MNQPLNRAVIERLKAEGYLEPAHVKEFTTSSADSYPSKLKSLLTIGAVPERAFAIAISSLQGKALLQSESYPRVAVAGTESLADFLREHEALPIVRQDDGLCVAMTDPTDTFIVNVLRAKFNCEIEPRAAIRSELLSALDRLYPYSKNAASEPTLETQNPDIPEDLENDSTLVRDLHRLIQRAVTAGASDIHFEPVNQTFRVRFRISGLLREIHVFPNSQISQVIARLKLMARLDVSERRRAQNGRFKFPADGRVMDLRVSTLPLHNGESIVLRLLEFTLSQSSLIELGFCADVAAGLEQAIAAQQGMVLVTGPTGSGKTTTLYSLLNRLNRPELKIVSIEDPVELDIAGINQIQVDDEHGISFAQALKSVLRQDPDVIMVGEIRDAETASLAAQAALTGHLLLSTLHTASAVSAITRLQNLGLPDYLISATLQSVLAQRLVRCICGDCAKSSTDAEPCASCDATGYQGRTTIAEFLPMTNQPKLRLDSENLENELQQQLLNGVTLRDDAARHVNSGLVDDAEIIRILGYPTNP